nr:hypothetical protein [Maliibacterium massiliense]
MLILQYLLCALFYLIGAANFCIGIILFSSVPLRLVGAIASVVCGLLLLSAGLRLTTKELKLDNTKFRLNVFITVGIALIVGLVAIFNI